MDYICFDINMALRLVCGRNSTEGERNTKVLAFSNIKTLGNVWGQLQPQQNRCLHSLNYPVIQLESYTTGQLQGCWLETFLLTFHLPSNPWPLFYGGS